MSKLTGKEVGEVFGRLTVVSAFKQGRFFRCLVRCECGSSKVVYRHNLIKGDTKSCGCLQKERARSANTVHGEKGTVLWTCWQTMRQRCNNKRHVLYPRYGGRGITVHPAWEDYVKFKRYVIRYLGQRPGPEYSLDRVDNEKGYVPGNLRWATPKEQANNTRRNVLIGFQGRKQTIAQWADEVGLARSTLLYRLKAGWQVGRALTEPLRAQNR